MTDASFNGTIPDFDELVEDTVGSAVEKAFENLDITDYLDGINLNNYIDVDSLIYDHDVVTSDGAWEIARDAINDEGGGSSDLDIYEVNEMLRQITEGRDCSDGNGFRDAVKAIVNAQILTGGSGPSDGTIMTMTATGTEREIQAILTRRKEYFEALLYTLGAAFEFFPETVQLPHTWTDEDGNSDTAAFINAMKKGIEENTTEQRDIIANSEPIRINKAIFDRLLDKTRRYGNVAKEAMKLVMLLRSLHDGEEGRTAIRNGQAAAEAADASIASIIDPPTAPITTTEEP